MLKKTVAACALSLIVSGCRNTAAGLTYRDYNTGVPPTNLAHGTTENHVANEANADAASDHAFANIDAVNAAYQIVLRRAPDSGGSANALTALNEQTAYRLQIAFGLVQSDEFDQIHKSENDADFVRAMYREYLRREPSESATNNEVVGWVNAVASLTRRGVATAFLRSKEFKTVNAVLVKCDFKRLSEDDSNEAAVDWGYCATLNRPADTDGRKNSIAVINNGAAPANGLSKRLAWLAANDGLTSSDEFKALTDAVPMKEFVGRLYSLLLKRTGSDAEIAGGLARGTRGAITQQFLNSPEFLSKQPLFKAPKIDPITGAVEAPTYANSFRYAVSHASPRYNGLGSLGGDILPAGAQDAYDLGFRALKIWLTEEVKSPSFYQFDAAIGAALKTMNDAVVLPQYQQVFNQGFKLYFIEAIPFGFSMENYSAAGNLVANDAAMLSSMDQQFYNLTKNLLQTYNGKGKIFVLQNHEADWHIRKSPLSRADDAYATGYANWRTYFSVAQSAISRARREVGATSDVRVYHMCESNLPLLSVKENKKSVASEVLNARKIADLVHPDGPVMPYLCDLAGYSAYESFAQTWPGATPSQAITDAINYLHTQLGPTFAFPERNVAVSEIGMFERTAASLVGATEAAMQTSLDHPNVWAISQWNLYDNECTVTDTTKNATYDQCGGYWIRKPDGTLGAIFQKFANVLDSNY